VATLFASAIVSCWVFDSLGEGNHGLKGQAGIHCEHDALLGAAELENSLEAVGVRLFARE